MSRIDISRAEILAQKLRGELGLGAFAPVNVKTMLRQMNILTMYRPLSDKLFGLSLKSKDGVDKFMLINSQSTRGRQHFTIAHELYHLLYEENPLPNFCVSQGDNLHVEKNAAELMADKFASAFLMPSEGILRMVSSEEIKSGKVALNTVIRLGQLYGVSHWTIVLRLKDLKLISQKYADELLAVSIKREASLRGIDLALYEPGNDGLIIGDYGILARKLYDKEMISEGHYLELLNVIGCGDGVVK